MELPRAYAHPLRFVDSVRSGSHIVLFYENSEYAQEIEFRFLSKGLENNEVCIYGAYVDPKIVIGAMRDQIYDADRHMKDRSLRIVELRSSGKERDPRSAALKRLEQLMQDVNTTYRVVSSLIDDLEQPANLKANTRIESSVHRLLLGNEEGKDLALFACAKGSIMCPYDISKITPELHGNWLISLIKNHDAAIFAPRLGDGIVLGRLG